ncbi:MAG: 2-amino-4-hydroxy-6-hydroxymethyldihydropteridine diphosphokinase [Acidobacteria bacterium]|nr:2-amino-4-hydroxy-6-hydroxymethyldihydropteridine diphosphokinase [Acidobacteriota bacterium]
MNRGEPRSPQPVLIAVGSNLGDRGYELRRSIHELRRVMRVVRISPVMETDPVDAPPGSGKFLNMVVAGWTRRRPAELLEELHQIERGRQRVRRVHNEPRRIDLDLILYGARIIRSRSLQVPHPRFRERSFVMDPIRMLNFPWVDPVTGSRLSSQSPPSLEPTSQL